MSTETTMVDLPITHKRHAKFRGVDRRANKRAAETIPANALTLVSVDYAAEYVGDDDCVSVYHYEAEGLAPWWGAPEPTT